MAQRPTSSHTTPAAGGADPTGHRNLRPAEPASLARRFGALMIDWLLCLLISGLFANPFVDGWAPVSVLILEYTFFVGFFGQTPGMRLLRLQCVGTATGRPVGPVRALLRAVLLAVVLPALVMDDQRRGWHDRAAGTVVIGPSAASYEPGSAAAAR